MARGNRIRGRVAGEKKRGHQHQSGVQEQEEDTKQRRDNAEAMMLGLHSPYAEVDAERATGPLQSQKLANKHENIVCKISHTNSSSILLVVFCT